MALDGADFGAKIFFFGFFLGGRRTENPEKNPRSQIEINQSQPTYEPRIEPRSQWWEARMMNPAPDQRKKASRLVLCPGRVWFEI